MYAEKYTEYPLAGEEGRASSRGPRTSLTLYSRQGRPGLPVGPLLRHPPIFEFLRSYFRLNPIRHTIRYGLYVSQPSEKEIRAENVYSIYGSDLITCVGMSFLGRATGV